MTDLANQEPVLDVKNLHVHHGTNKSTRFHAVKGVDLELAGGEILALVGESGSGKSTIARALMGLAPISEGEVLIEGEPLSSSPKRASRRHMQMVFQDPFASLNPRRTIGSILEELVRVNFCSSKDEARALSADALSKVGLPPSVLERYPRAFSGGQRQRIAIARALILKPRILIADEPVSALDVSIQASVLNLLAGLRNSFGISVLFIAHNLAVVRHVSDRVAVMQRGEIVETSPTNSLFSAPNDPYTARLLAAIPTLER